MDEFDITFGMVKSVVNPLKTFSFIIFLQYLITELKLILKIRFKGL